MSQCSICLKNSKDPAQVFPRVLNDHKHTAKTVLINGEFNKRHKLFIGKSCLTADVRLTLVPWTHSAERALSNRCRRETFP